VNKRFWIARDRLPGDGDYPDDPYWLYDGCPRKSRSYLGAQVEFRPPTKSVLCYRLHDGIENVLGCQLEPGECAEFRMMRHKKS